MKYKIAETRTRAKPSQPASQPISPKNKQTNTLMNKQANKQINKQPPQNDNSRQNKDALAGLCLVLLHNNYSSNQ